MPELSLGLTASKNTKEERSSDFTEGTADKKTGAGNP